MTAPRLGEAAILQPCPACRQHTLLAMSGGLRIRADPENLTVTGELAARLDNRDTFDVQIHGLPRRMYLEYRTLLRIRGPRKHPVVGQHSCGSKFTLISAPLDETASEIVIPYRRSAYPLIPPF